MTCLAGHDIAVIAVPRLRRSRRGPVVEPGRSPHPQRGGDRQRRIQEHRREPRFISGFHPGSARPPPAGRLRPPPPSWTACQKHPTSRPGPPSPGGSSPTSGAAGPRLGEPIVRHRGRFCYVSAQLPGYREPAPILRLRYQGSADRWAIGIYLASSDRYTESELPSSFGPKTGTPEEGVDDTFILYAGPKTGRLLPPLS